ncbi:MAG: hypothetical protein JSR77_10740 [Planctomycetes bacterium]|nr:hypothetical protein [Planctomycetota bacterium]
MKLTRKHLGAWIVLCGVGIGAVLAMGWASGSLNFGAAAGPSAKQKAAVLYDFPVSRGTLPRSLIIEYDAAKDRTQMKLALAGVTPAASQFKAGPLTLTFESQFKGKVRSTEVGELSVECVVTGVCGVAGALAPSSPPAEFTADGVVYKARPPVKGVSPYRSKAKSDGVHETLVFRVMTRDLVAMVKAREVSATLGGVSAKLNAAQIEDLREFAARINPNL